MKSCLSFSSTPFEVSKRLAVTTFQGWHIASTYWTSWTLWSGKLSALSTFITIYYSMPLKPLAHCKSKLVTLGEGSWRAQCTREIGSQSFPTDPREYTRRCVGPVRRRGDDQILVYIYESSVPTCPCAEAAQVRLLTTRLNQKKSISSLKSFKLTSKKGIGILLTTHSHSWGFVNYQAQCEHGVRFLWLLEGFVFCCCDSCVELGPGQESREREE